MSDVHFHVYFRMRLPSALTVVSFIVLAVHVTPYSVGAAVLTFRRDETCQQRCTPTTHRMVCNDCIPHDVSNTVDEIELNALHSYRIVAHGFCNVSWMNVKMLSISYKFFYPDDYPIVDYAFNCLYKIERLKLSIQRLTILTAYTLTGLLNVRLLDLTGCVRLATPALTKGFSMNSVVPNLNRLILSNIGSRVNGIKLSREFIDVLAQRNITEINLSSSFVEFENISYGRLCETLQKLDVSNTRILYTSNFPLAACKSLKVVDFSGTQFPRTPFPQGNLTIPQGTPFIWDEDWFNFFSRAQIFFVNDMLSVDHFVYIYNSTFTVVNSNSVSELHVCGYNVPILEVEVFFRQNQLMSVDISNNRIERLSQNIFRNLKHLQILDLSYNKLGIATTERLTVLFRNNSKLMSLNLAYNDLAYLPREVLKFNRKLKLLYLRGNKIAQIHFEIAHLIYLCYIDLRNNVIEYLDDSSMRQIDMLYNKKQAYKNGMITNRSFVIDLRDNPFSCSCRSLDFIEWFVNSPIFKGSRDEYHCDVDGQYISMNTNAVTAAKYDCDKPKRKLRQMLLSTLLPCISLGIAIVVSIILFKKYREFKGLQKLRENVALINDERCGHRFPVFLSYASEDSQFVEVHIFKPMKVSFCFLL